MLKIYTYAKCDTCRKAVKFLRAHEITHQEIPIRETPPSLAELQAMLAAHSGEIRRLFNTAGGDYKVLGLSQRLPELSSHEALELLTTNGNLVKRPFAIGPKVNLVGFKESDWKEALVSKDQA